MSGKLADHVTQSKGDTPVTLAEFTLASSTGQTFYDISLVDGYNLPVGIVSLHTHSSNSSIVNIPPNLTNPVCIATAGLLADQGSSADSTLGTNSSFPLPLDESVSQSDVANWCPWNLQLSPPSGPSNGVYSYPDTNLQRPQFDPCYSACAKWNLPSDCCTGQYGSPSSCKPSDYSKAAKKMCPDAYSYGGSIISSLVASAFRGLTAIIAFDDQTSTFAIPSGGGFEVIFCPPGRSTTILTSEGDKLRQLGQTGSVSKSEFAVTGLETQWATTDTGSVSQSQLTTTQLETQQGPSAQTRTSKGAAEAPKATESILALIAVLVFAIWT